jgi:hypothetical protein
MVPFRIDAKGDDPGRPGARDRDAENADNPPADLLNPKVAGTLTTFFRSQV